MFISSALALLSSSPKDAVTRLADADVIVRILRTRIFPEVEALSEKDSMEARGRAVKLVLELMCIQNGGEHEYLVVQFCHWYQDTQTWKSSIENTIRDVVSCGQTGLNCFVHDRNILGHQYRMARYSSASPYDSEIYARSRPKTYDFLHGPLII